MRVQQNTHKLLHKLAESSKLHMLQDLKTGDILQGTVKQLFPNHKAAIQLQGNQVTAQLEASLSVGGKYFFQVNSSESKLPELKVVGQQQQNVQQTVIALLQELGLKDSKPNQQLIRTLIQLQIPFQRAEVVQAINYMQVNGLAVQKALPVITQLMESRIPVTDASFRAVQTFQNSNFSERLTALERSLPSNQPLQAMVQTHLTHLLKGFSSEQEALRTMLLADGQQAKPTVFPLLQQLGMIPPAVSKQDWVNVLQRMTTLPVQHQQLAAFSSPALPVNLEGMKQQIQAIVSDQQLLMLEAKAMLTANTTNAVNVTQTAAQTAAASAMKNHFPQFFSKKAPTVPANEPVVRQLLEALTDSKNFQVLERFIHLSTVSNEKEAAPKEHFLQQLQWMFRDAGLNAEASLKTDMPATAQFKHLLLEMIHTSSGISKENAQQVVHFLNGMQLNNVQDGSYFLQASLQIPSQKLGLSKDIDVHFEGKKTSDGKIDPEYCRIIFDLFLNKMKETIIDLHVQKKAVSITVYNDHVLAPKLVQTFKSTLNENLNQLDYTLLSIICKSYTEEKKQSANVKSTQEQNLGKVDFRV